ncbi:PREDICTED: mastin, partial [Myotis davidii]|uniref:mastin n=1 Tax=Myotis davidii TaxID=225400 RepID=UPI000767A0EE
ALGSEGLAHSLPQPLRRLWPSVPRRNPVTWHFKVQLGQMRPSYSDSVQVARIIRHPKYSLEKKAVGGADVALLKLEASVRPSNLVRWIRLPPASLSFPPGTRCWVTGWGDIAFEALRLWPYQLQEVMVPIVGNEVCNQCYQNSSTNTGQIIKDDMLCAGSEGQDSCQGDSGGPLVCSWEGIWVQVGIVSWGYSCGHRDFPGVYARVMSYISWIRKYVPLCPGS